MTRPAWLDSVLDRLEPILDRLKRADWLLVLALSSLTTGVVLMVISRLYPWLDTEIAPEPPTAVLESCEDALMHAAKASTPISASTSSVRPPMPSPLISWRLRCPSTRTGSRRRSASAGERRGEEAVENTRGEQRSLMGQRANDCRNGVR